MKKAREYFEKEKVNKKLVCKDVFSGDAVNKNLKFCNARLADNGNTSV